MGFSYLKEGLVDKHACSQRRRRGNCGRLCNPKRFFETGVGMVYIAQEHAYIMLELALRFYLCTVMMQRYTMDIFLYVVDPDIYPRVKRAMKSHERKIKT